MAGIAKVVPSGSKPSQPLLEKEIGYDTDGNELYIGSGSGTADGNTDAIDANEVRVTRNKELNELTDRVEDLKTESASATADGDETTIDIKNRDNSPLSIYLNGILNNETLKSRTTTSVTVNTSDGDEVYVVAHNG